ncbi:coadhesin-like [Amphiura filiformis]|uniref:coadhesin-like n=1 Tax=Amphiura filiformis TaxID=82378 RepID=UPI003B211BAF
MWVLYRHNTLLMIQLLCVLTDRVVHVRPHACEVGQEKDKDNIWRWSLPYEDPCQCTSVRFGGLNAYTPVRPFEPTYVDTPWVGDDVEKIWDHYNLTCNAWKSWGAWGTCSASCCGGEQSRARTCLSSGYQFCVGSESDTRVCTGKQGCPAWVSWGAWGTCSASCCGEQSRTRTCISCGDPSTGCVGAESDEQACNTQECPAWTSWEAWSSCSASCCGEQSRTRTCRSCGYSSTGCSGAGRSERSCNTQRCLAWTSWGAWGTCSASCCGGEQSRNRTCLSCGDPSTDCVGAESDEQKCNTQECPAWTSWEAWSSCSASCCGEQSRTRTCRSCGYSSTGCSGAGRSERSCNTQRCLAWTSWGAWGTCSASCCGGEQSRNRTCLSCGDPSTDCVGAESDEQKCNTQECPEWASWGSWGSCSAECCGGTRTRRRTCYSCDGGSSSGCSGSSSNSEDCNTHSCRWHNPGCWG